MVNINKRNRLLYSGRLYNKYALDLYSENKTKNKEIIDYLFSSRKPFLKICDLTDASEQNQKLLKKITCLLRETAKDLRESGDYDLYIGYPFVCGRMLGENFNIRAPLAFRYICG